MALTFYHVHWCPECMLVRQKLDELQLSYDEVVVPDARAHRKQVYEVSGQYYVPVIADRDVVLTETWEILEYLDDRYGEKRNTQSEPAPRDAGTADRRSETPTELTDDDQYPSCQR
jgi:glutathione S-transferase